MKSQSTILVAGIAALAFAAHAADGDFFRQARAGRQGRSRSRPAGRKQGHERRSARVRRDDGRSARSDEPEARRRSRKPKGIELPTTPSKAQLDSIKALQAKKGAQFDQEYLAEQVKAHEETVQLLKSEIASGQDPDAKAFAREILPTVESHLRKAYHLAGKDEMAEACPSSSLQVRVACTTLGRPGEARRAPVAQLDRAADF